MTSFNHDQDNIREIFSKDDPAVKAKNSQRAIPKLIGSIGAIVFTLGLIILAISGQANIYSLGLVGIGFFMLVAFMLVDFKNVKLFLTARSTVYSANLMILILTLLGILIVVNAVAANRFVAFDLTENKDFTLSQHTTNVIKQLNETKRELEIIAFFRNDDPRRFDIKMLLDQYSFATPSISYKFVDYEINKRLASEFGVDRPSILLDSDSKQFVYDFTESGVTGGIISLVNPEKIIVGVVIGHGELSSSDTDGKSISEFAHKLEKENYIVKPLRLSTDGIPQEMSVLLIPAPKDTFSDLEINTIKNYMEQGGAVALFLEPFHNAGLDNFLADLGLNNPQDLIIDQASNYFNDQKTPYISAFLTHPVTISFLADSMAGDRVEGIVMPTATSLVILNNVSKNVLLEPLALSSEKSWGGSNPDKIEIGEDDIRGPITVAVAGRKLFTVNEPSQNVDLDDESELADVTFSDSEIADSPNLNTDQSEPRKIESRFLVVGDADMITNTNIDLGNNYNLVLNSFNWLTSAEEMMGERQLSDTDRLISLNSSQTKAVQVINLMIPLLVAGFGVFMWFKKR